MVNWRSKKKRVFVLTSRLYESAGGRTKATIDRIKFLQRYFDVTLIEMSATKYPGEELPAIFEKYNATFATVNPWHVGRDNSSQTKNYTELLRERTGGLADKRLLRGAQERFVLPTMSGGTIKSYLENGRIKRLREYHPDGRTELFALDDKRNIFMRELYQAKKLIARYYLDDRGNVLSGFTTSEKGKQYIYRTSDDEVVYSKNITRHNYAFLTDILESDDVVISDVRYYDDVLEQLDPSIKKIHVWHEIATTEMCEVLPAYERYSDPNYKVAPQDKIVVFTEDAAEEYKCFFPHLSEVFVPIPYGTDVTPQTPNVHRDSKAIVSIGRLEAGKNVAAQIRAFALFHATHPETSLHIFGEGESREKLEQLVHQLGLERAVKFHGFALNVDAEFQRAAMMIFSSDNETFGLTILESLRNGTPVATYNVRFGARTMITNLQNGMIANERTPESLAEAMTTLYEAQLPQQQVRASIASTFNRERFEKKWLDVISNDTEKMQ